MTDGAVVTLEPLRPDDPESLGAFHLLGGLGRGGMGAVYLGRDAHDRLAAVKLIRRDLTESAESLARFRREARLGASLRAQCVAAVLDFQVDHSPVWLASEYVQGPSLCERITESGPLSEPQVRAVASGMAEALCAIHAAEIVHRDLTYNNVLLAADGPKVIDFGIARVVDGTRVTSTGGLIGTPNWISPERWKGEQGGPPADVFAWAVTVLATATGRVPYGQGHPEQIRHRILTEPPELDALGDPVAAAVASALEQDPRRRPTALELCARLSGTQATEQAEATRSVTLLLRSAWDLRDPAHDSAAPPAPIRSQNSAGSSPRPETPPFTYRRRRYRDPAALAAAMAGDVPGAVELFQDDTQRPLLRDWLIHDLDETTLDRGLLRRPVSAKADSELLVVGFIEHFLSKERMRAALRKQLRGDLPDHLLGSRILAVAGSVHKGFPRWRAAVRAETVRALTEEGLSAGVLAEVLHGCDQAMFQHVRQRLEAHLRDSGDTELAAALVPAAQQNGHRVSSRCERIATGVLQSVLGEWTPQQRSAVYSRLQSRADRRLYHRRIAPKSGLRIATVSGARAIWGFCTGFLLVSFATVVFGAPTFLVAGWLGMYLYAMLAGEAAFLADWSAPVFLDWGAQLQALVVGSLLVTLPIGTFLVWLFVTERRNARASEATPVEPTPDDPGVNAGVTVGVLGVLLLSVYAASVLGLLPWSG